MLELTAQFAFLFFGVLFMVIFFSEKKYILNSLIKKETVKKTVIGSMFSFIYMDTILFHVTPRVKTRIRWTINSLTTRTACLCNNTTKLISSDKWAGVHMVNITSHIQYYCPVQCLYPVFSLLCFYYNSVCNLTKMKAH